VANPLSAAHAGIFQTYHTILRSGFKPAYLRRNFDHQLLAKLLSVNKWLRALFLAEYTLKYEIQRIWNQ
jgi:hypothetical protein